MKHFFSKRVLALLLCSLMVLTTLSAVLTVSAAGAVEHSVQNGTGARTALRVGNGFSYRASVKYEFTGFSFAMPTWNNKNSHATLYLYKWQGSYEATLASEPIASKTFDPLTDNHQHWVTFDPQPAGEYLFHVADASYDAGVWTNINPTNSKGFLYVNGIEQTGDPDMRIRFTEAVSDPFDTCERSQDLMIKKEIYSSANGLVIYNMNQSVGVRLNVAAPVRGMEAQFGT